MRQKDDLEFASALNALGSSSLSAEQIALFKSRETNKPTQEALYICSTNYETEQYINIRIRETNTDEYNAESIDKCYGNLDNSDYYLNIFKQKSSRDTIGLTNNIMLKLSLRYMIILNMDTPDGLVNGASGKLMKVSLMNNIPNIAWLKFENDKVGKKRLAESVKECNDNQVDRTFNWIPIKRVEKAFNVTKDNKVLVRRRQFPLTNCEALTAHKCQGGTYKKIAVKIVSQYDVNGKPYKRSMTRAQLYVACSRTNSLAGLEIIGKFIDPTGISDKNKVKIEMERLRMNCQLIFDLKFAEDLKQKDEMQIIIHNIRSLKNKKEIIERDVLYNQSEIICLCEAWCSEKDDLDIKGYKILNKITNRFDINRNIGSVIYIKDEFVTKTELYKSVIKYQEKHNQNYYTIEIVKIKSEKFIYLISTYKSPKYPINEYLNNLNEIINRIPKNENELAEIIIAGDFNINYIKNKELFNDLQEKFGISFKLKQNFSSTIYDTQIDLCFSNTEIKCESLFSDH